MDAKVREASQASAAPQRFAPPATPVSPVVAGVAPAAPSVVVVHHNDSNPWFWFWLGHATAPTHTVVYTQPGVVGAPVYPAMPVHHSAFQWILALLVWTVIAIVILVVIVKLVGMFGNDRPAAAKPQRYSL